MASSEEFLRLAFDLVSSVEDSIDQQQDNTMSGDFHEYLMRINMRDLTLAQTYIMLSQVSDGAVGDNE